MKIRQLSVFLENKPGQLSRSCRALADAGVNILTLSLADTQQFGVLRLIVGDVEAAGSALQDAGCVVKVTEVIAVEAEDRPGGLAAVLEAIEAKGINVDYMYPLTARRGRKAVLIFRFDDNDAALAAIRDAGASIVAEADL